MIGTRKYELTCESEQVASDWAKIILQAANLQGQSNPLNDQVQAAFTRAGGVAEEHDKLVSNYSDFKFADEEGDVDPDPEPANPAIRPMKPGVVKGAGEAVPASVEPGDAAAG